jgi:CRP/FNR family transcriptional regulator
VIAASERFDFGQFLKKGEGEAVGSSISESAASRVFSGMQKNSLTERLRGLPLFSELDDSDLATLGRCCTETHPQRGTVLFREGDPFYGFYVVLEGKVKVYKLGADGRESMLHIIGPLSSLAEIPMFLGGGYPAYAETLEDSTLLCVFKDGFLALLHTHPELSLKMLAGLSRRLKTLGERIERLTALDVKTRLARYLLDEAGAAPPQVGGCEITLSISKTLLAASLGTIVETLSRAFRKLESEGCIRVHGKRIALVDAGELRRRYAGD